MDREEAILIIGWHKKDAERLAGKTLAGQKSAEAFNMAIEALSAIEDIKAEIKEQYGGCGLINDGLDMALSIIDKYRAESTSEIPNKWIPVSERLPEKDGDYLLFGKVVEDDTDDTFIGMYDACAEKFGYWEDYYDENTLGFLDSELIEYNKVTAWMPLPEPYETQESEEV